MKYQAPDVLLFTISPLCNKLFPLIPNVLHGYIIGYIDQDVIALGDIPDGGQDGDHIASEGRGQLHVHAVSPQESMDVAWPLGGTVVDDCLLIGRHMAQLQFDPLGLCSPVINQEIIHGTIQGIGDVPKVGGGYGPLPPLPGREQAL